MRVRRLEVVDEYVDPSGESAVLVEGFSDLLVRRGDDLPAAERDEYVQRIADAAREMRELLDRAVG